MTERALTLLSIIGLASQFVASALLAVLYALLGREVRRRGYFQQWGRAWNALAIALGVLVVRYEVLPLLGVHLTHNWILSNSVGAVYQLGKLLWCLFLVVGTAQFVNGTRRPQATRSGILIALAYAVVSAVAAGSAAQILIWQSPIAMTALAYCAWLMLRLPRSRRSLGSRFAGWAFAINALLWGAYLPASVYRILYPEARNALLSVLFWGNSFLDQMVGIALGYGMVVLLLEDAKREVDAAHAELAGAHHELRRSALYDAVTGSLNRRAFEEGVGLEHARAAFGAVAMMDLDNLKAVNDTQGHHAGDVLLRRVAEAIRGGLRPSDKLYRWGGDEFLLVMPGAAVEDLLRRVERLLAAAGPPPLLVSIGGAAYEGAEGLALAIPAADAAMYEVKKRRKLAAAELKAAEVVA